MFDRVEPGDESGDAACSAYIGPEEGNVGNLRAQNLNSLAGNLIRVDPITGNLPTYLSIYLSVSVYPPFFRTKYPLNHLFGSLFVLHYPSIYLSL